MEDIEQLIISSVDWTDLSNHQDPFDAYFAKAAYLVDPFDLLDQLLDTIIQLLAFL